MGPLEVAPGTHVRTQRDASVEHTAYNRSVSVDEGGGGGGGDDGEDEVVHALRLVVHPGDATIYWASLLHRGGAHVGSRSRPTFHIAVIGDGAPPTGMPYTVLVDDILKGVASMPGPESQT